MDSYVVFGFESLDGPNWDVSSTDDPNLHAVEGLAAYRFGGAFPTELLAMQYADFLNGHCDKFEEPMLDGFDIVYHRDPKGKVQKVYRFTPMAWNGWDSTGILYGSSKVQVDDTVERVEITKVLENEDIVVRLFELGKYNYGWRTERWFVVWEKGAKRTNGRIKETKTWFR